MPFRRTISLWSFFKSGYLHDVSHLPTLQFLSMKITITISPKNTSFPALIINELETSIMPRMPGQPFYVINFPIRSVDIQKGSLDISGVIRGQANSPLELVIDVFVDTISKPPKNIRISGRYSNKSSFIFKTNVSISKQQTGFPGKRI